MLDLAVLLLTVQTGEASATFSAMQPFSPLGSKRLLPAVNAGIQRLCWHSCLPTTAGGAAISQESGLFRFFCVAGETGVVPAARVRGAI